MRKYIRVIAGSLVVGITVLMNDSVIVEAMERQSVKEVELRYNESAEVKANSFSVEYLVTGKKVAIRDGAGTSYNIVGYVYKDDVVHVISIKDGWAKFKMDGKSRYVKASSLKKK